MSHASREVPENPATPDADEPRDAATGQHAKPRRLPAWTCLRCGARKHLRGAQRG